MVADEGVAIELVTIRHGLHGIRTFWSHTPLHISQNAPYLSPKILHNFSLSFLLGITAVQEKSKTKLMQKLEEGGGGGWGANKVHYGRCASGVWLNSMATRVISFFFFFLTF